MAKPRSSHVHALHIRTILVICRQGFQGRMNVFLCLLVVTYIVSEKDLILARVGWFLKSGGK